MIRYLLRRRGLLVVPVPPDPKSLRDAGRGTRVVTREWLNSVADLAERVTS